MTEKATPDVLFGESAATEDDSDQLVHFVEPARRHSAPTRTPPNAGATPDSTDPLDTEFENPSLAIRPVITNHAQDLGVVLGETKVELAAREAKYVGMQRATGLPAYGVMTRIAELDTEADLAEGRGAEDLTDVEHQRYHEETRQQLISTYGQDEAAALLVRAAAFVRTSPALATVLSRRAIGSRADVVVPIIEHIRAVNWRG